MSGATKFDKLCHRAFDGQSDGTNYLAKKIGVCCGNCGKELLAYYCEERLYLVECDACGIKALTKANSAEDAAYKTIAHEVISIDDMGEELAVFFDTAPICDPPFYVGSTIDCDFPDGAKCAMLLPCPGSPMPLMTVDGGDSDV